MQSFFKYLQSIYPITPEAQASMIRMVRQKELRKGQLWLQQGSVCDKLTFIEKGLAKLYFETGNKEVALSYHKEDDIMVSVQSYFRQTPSEFSIKAVEPCTVFYLQYSDMNFLLQRYAGLNINTRLILEHYYSMSELHVGLLLKPPRVRFETVQKLHPWMVDGSRITDKMLAAYIGVTPASICYYRSQQGVEGQRA